MSQYNGSGYNPPFNSAVHDVLARYFSQQINPQQVQALTNRLSSEWPSNGMMEQTLQNAGLGPSPLRTHLIEALNQIHPQSYAPQPQYQQQSYQPPQYQQQPYQQPQYQQPYPQPQYQQPYQQPYPPQPYYQQPYPQQPYYQQPYPPQPYYQQPYPQPYYGPNYGYQNYGMYGAPGVLALEQWALLDGMFMGGMYGGGYGFQPGLGFTGGQLLLDAELMGMAGGGFYGKNPLQVGTEIYYDAKEMNDLARGDIGGFIGDEIKKDVLEGFGL